MVSCILLLFRQSISLTKFGIQCLLSECAGPPLAVGDDGQQPVQQDRSEHFTKQAELGDASVLVALCLLKWGINVAFPPVLWRLPGSQHFLQQLCQPIDYCLFSTL